MRVDLRIARREDVQRLFLPPFFPVVRFRRAGTVREFSITPPPPPLLRLLLNRPRAAMQVDHSGTLTCTISLRHRLSGLQR